MVSPLSKYAPYEFPLPSLIVFKKVFISLDTLGDGYYQEEYVHHGKINDNDNDILGRSPLRLQKGAVQ